MASLRLALLLETDEVFVELEPGVLKTLITSLLKDGVSAEDLYAKLVSELEKLTYRK